MSAFPRDMPIFFSVYGQNLRLKRKKVNNRFKRYLILNAGDNKGREASYWIARPNYCSDRVLHDSEIEPNLFEHRQLTKNWKKFFKGHSTTARVSIIKESNDESVDTEKQNELLDSPLLEAYDSERYELDDDKADLYYRQQIGSFTISNVRRRGKDRNRIFMELKGKSNPKDFLTGLEQGLKGNILLRFNNLNSWKPYWYPDARKQELQGINFRSMNLKNANFSGADLTDARFINTKLRNSNFKGANLEGAIFLQSDLTGAQFDDNAFSTTGVTVIGTICPNGVENGRRGNLLKPCTSNQMELI